MGYIGLLAVLKDRVLAANRPINFSKSHWETITRQLNYEDKWEQTIFDAVMMKGDDGKKNTKPRDPVFSINDDLRNQIRYWKDRRNDCAHNKDNLITGFHIECFWSFLESNLRKITVEGGKATLLNKIKRHYDPSYTSGNSEVFPLIKEIKGGVDK